MLDQMVLEKPLLRGGFCITNGRRALFISIQMRWRNRSSVIGICVIMCSRLRIIARNGGSDV